MKLPTIKLSKKAALIAISTAVVILGLGGTSAYAAHSNALPGSTLYPFKRVWEEGSLLLALSPASKAKTHVGIAHNRINAAQAVPAPTTVVVPALQQAQQQLNTALDQSNKVSDPTQRKEIKDSISKEAANAESELEHSSESESSRDKQNAQNTSDQLKQIKDQASTND